MNIIQKVNKKILLYIVCIICIFGATSKIEAAGITIKDPKMKEALQKKIGKEEITREDLEKITELDISNLGISSLDGVQYMSNLTTLKARNNNITSIGELYYLNQLDYLDFAYNQISDISVLDGKLFGGYLDVSYNCVTTFEYLRKANLEGKAVILVSTGNTVDKGIIPWEGIMKKALDLRERLPIQPNYHHMYGPRSPGKISHNGTWSETGSAAGKDWVEYATWDALANNIKEGDKVYYDWWYGRDVFTVGKFSEGTALINVMDCVLKKGTSFDPTMSYQKDGSIIQGSVWAVGDRIPITVGKRNLQLADVKYNNVNTKKVGDYSVYYQYEAQGTGSFSGISVSGKGKGQKFITVTVVDDVLSIPVEIEWNGSISTPVQFKNLDFDILYASIRPQSFVYRTTNTNNEVAVRVINSETPSVDVKKVQWDSDIFYVKGGMVTLGDTQYNVSSSIEGNGNARKIKIVFDKAQSDVTIKKVTEDSALLPNAVLTLAKVDGENNIVMEKWKTTDLEKVVSVDKNITYTLVEEEAPEGYLLAKSITFRVNDNNTVEIKNEQGEWEDTGKSVISMVDQEASSVRVKKIDRKGNFVVGAKLKVVEGEGNGGTIVKEWVSTEKEEQINVGENIVYTLLEEEVPEGYRIAKPIIFRVNSLGTVEIKDEQGKWEDTKERDLYMIAHKLLPVHIYHTDINKNVITGSSIKLLKRDDKSLVEAWKSEEGGKVINLDELIEYILSEEEIDNSKQIKEFMTFSTNSEVNVLSGSSIKERSVNNGYQVAESIVFRVNQDGNVEIEELQGVWKDTGTNQLYLISKNLSSDGGDTQEPSDGGDTQEPSDGGDTQEPSDEGNTQKPSDEGNTQEPSDGGNTQEPSDEGNTQKPSDGGNTQKPSDGGNAQRPYNGGNTRKPSNGGNTHKKSDTRNNQKVFSREDAQKESSDKDFLNKGKRGLWLEEKEEMTNNKNTGLLLGKSASIDVKGVQGQKNKSLPQTKDTIKTTIYIYVLSFIFIVIGIVRRLFNKYTIK